MAPRPWMRALGSLNEMLDRRAGVVPAGTPLTEGQRDRIRQWVASGRRLVTPHEDLLDRLGFGRTPEVPVSSVRMDGLAEDAIWPQPLPVRPLQSRGLVPAATTGTATIVGTTSVDAGQVLGIAVDPLGAARDGHELLPGLGRLAVTFTAAPPGPARTGAEVYLDPGSLHNGVSGKPEDLARRLAGARAVHIAGWNADNRDPRFDYDYASLIAALHARGELAYAWLEPAIRQPPLLARPSRVPGADRDRSGRPGRLAATDGPRGRALLRPGRARLAQGRHDLSLRWRRRRRALFRTRPQPRRLHAVPPGGAGPVRRRPERRSHSLPGVQDPARHRPQPQDAAKR